ncbi:hypothetical protein WICMUC_002939 [Wickerhamomyces mucosus]|uniref:Uncharacterized protein n=1 Tax=Wickerhamomyces mucosus TaxID=1378264 RepID=A0A9P8PMQ5_9ASCO|nr:hypothetical protein WICMUC_002939 [Wickerhamomyces mucosus]
MENSCISNELNKFRNEVIPEILNQSHSVSSTNQIGFPPSSPSLNSQVQRKVSIAGHNRYETELTSLVPSNVGRSNSIYNMLKSYNEIFNKLQKLTIKKATKLELCKFHDEGFVNFLLKKRSIFQLRLHHNLKLSRNINWKLHLMACLMRRTTTLGSW